MLIDYLKGLTLGRALLWCYLIWYLVMAAAYFDPSPRLWLTSVGLSLVIGCALILSVSAPQARRLDRWQVFRLFCIPFCASSFAALAKDRGFILIFSSEVLVSASALALCAVFLALVGLTRWLAR
ncbi:MAG: hypothetical protein WD929_00885 [Steroidobacteraceae bacterium]